MRWLFFDIGSTLINEGVFNKYLFGYVYDTIENSNTKITHEDFDETLKKIIAERRFGERAYIGIVEGLVKHFTSNKKVLSQVLERYNRYAAKRYIEKMEPYPDSLRTVIELKKIYKLGIIANQPAKTKQKITSFSLAEHFDVIVLSGEVSLRKPDPRIFQLALKMAKCSAKDATMIGDRLDADIGPSKLLGFRTIRIKHGIMVNQNPLNNFEVPDQEVNTLIDLLNIL